MVWTATPSVLGEPSVPGRFRSRCGWPHHQFWGSQVCPGSSAHGVNALTVSSGGARCVQAVPLTPLVLGEPGVSGKSHSHCQFWGSQVCPGGSAHTISSGGAGCVRVVPLTPSVLGEPGVSGRSRSHCQFWGSWVCPGGPAHAVDSRFRPAGTATCSIWSTCSSTGPTWGPRTPRGTPPCTSAPSTTRSVAVTVPPGRGCAQRFVGGCPAPGAVMKP